MSPLVVWSWKGSRLLTCYSRMLVTVLCAPGAVLQDLPTWSQAVPSAPPGGVPERSPFQRAPNGGGGFLSEMPAMWRGRRSAYTPPSWHQVPQTLAATILSLSFKDFKGLCKNPRDGAHHIQTSSLPLSPFCPRPAFGPCVYLCQGLETQQRMKLGGIPQG